MCVYVCIYTYVYIDTYMHILTCTRYIQKVSMSSKISCQHCIHNTQRFASMNLTFVQKVKHWFKQEVQ